MITFRNNYRRIEKSPNCGQCGFRSNQIDRLQHAGIDLYSQAQRDAHGIPAYSKQAAMMERAVNTRANTASCWWCMRLGDSIISLLAPTNHTIVTTDNSFVPLCAILGKKLLQLPSPEEMAKGGAAGSANLSLGAEPGSGEPTSDEAADL